MGARQKRNRRQDLLTAFHTLPPPPSLGISYLEHWALAPTPRISRQKIKTFFKYSICLRNLREFLYWSWKKKKNQPGFRPKPLPGGRLSVTALPLQPRVYIKLGEGVENKRCHLAQIRASSPKEPYPHRGSFAQVAILFGSSFLSFLPAVRSTIWRVACLLRGPGGPHCMHYEWARLCQ